MIGISVDPVNDNPKRAASFLLKQQMTGRMRFLLGTREQLEPVWKAFAVQPQADRLEHSAHTVLADARGFQRIGFPFDHLTSGAGARPRPAARSDLAGARHRTRPRDGCAVSGRSASSSTSASGRRTSARRWPRSRRAATTAAESTHIVSPPGSGTTLLGVELIRRIGRRALVLRPTRPSSSSGRRRSSAFTAQPRSMVGPDPLKPIACLTYQGLCDIEDPEMVLGRLAQSRWADERAAATGITPEEAMREFEGEDADQRARELARIQGVLKREVAQGEAARRRAARPALDRRARARPAALQARRQRRGARRVPPPGVAVGLRRSAPCWARWATTSTWSG